MRTHAATVLGRHRYKTLALVQTTSTFLCASFVGHPKTDIAVDWAWGLVAALHDGSGWALSATKSGLDVDGSPPLAFAIAAAGAAHSPVAKFMHFAVDGASSGGAFFTLVHDAALFAAIAGLGGDHAVTSPHAATAGNSAAATHASAPCTPFRHFTVHRARLLVTLLGVLEVGADAVFVFGGIVFGNCTSPETRTTAASLGAGRPLRPLGGVAELGARGVDAALAGFAKSRAVLAASLVHRLNVSDAGLLALAA